MYFPMLAACVGFGCWHMETAHWQIITCCQATLQRFSVAQLCRGAPVFNPLPALLIVCLFLSDWEAAWLLLLAHFREFEHENAHLLFAACMPRLTKEDGSCLLEALWLQDQSFLYGTVQNIHQERFIGCCSVMVSLTGNGWDSKWRLSLTEI